MKKYLWAVMVVLFVSANASGFRDIDIETHSFLSDLREAAGSDDEFLDDEDEEIQEDAIDEPEAIEDEKKVSEADKAENIRQKAIDDAKKKSS